MYVKILNKKQINFFKLSILPSNHNVYIKNKQKNSGKMNISKFCSSLYNKQ